ncbi:MAG TPA: GNAT family N-acetyltransferase [Candidatus Limnocylindrales bacterium]|nr:GNAT family N-acetyltransferase [Candidatus Limnocylindrales bacterium]
MAPSEAEPTSPRASAILTERLALRPFTPDDLDALLAMFGDPEVTRHLDHGPLSREAARELLARISPMTGIDAQRNELRLAVELQASGGVIGDVSLWRTSTKHNQGEIGFVLHPEHQGHGYASEGVRELLRIGFEEAGLHRIVGRCDAENTASAALMERLGMRREAHFRENERIKGAWSDGLVYAMLASEWAAR